MLKYSKQREAIKTFLAPRTDHPTAELVFENIRKQYPNISLGTVYRNLALLASLGEITKLSCQDNFDRFDPNPSPHYHFQCRLCNAVSDIPMPVSDTLNQEAASYFDGEIDSHTVFFHGSCLACKNI